MLGEQHWLVIPISMLPHPGDYLTFQVDLIPRIYYAWLLLHIQSCWNIQFKYEHYEWSQWSITWTTHDSCVEAPAKKAFTLLIWLHCITKITTAAQGRRNGDVLNHRPVVETICIPPLHPQWYFKNHNIGSNHTTWTHKWNFLRYCRLQTLWETLSFSNFQ